jgi:hypothetical protein
MEWDTVGRSGDIELSSNCLTATKTSSATPSTVRGTILYNDTGVHEFHVILDSLGPDGIWVGVASPDMDPTKCVGDVGCGWALHSDGDRRFNGREEEFTGGLSQPGCVLGLLCWRMLWRAASTFCSGSCQAIMAGCFCDAH